MKNYKYLLIVFAISFLFLFFAQINYANALEIKDYPRIPGLPILNEANLKSKDALGIYIGYFFGLGTYIVGVIALIALVIGGIRLIMSIGNPESIKDAKESIIGAVIGLVLTLSSFIIIRTINPQLITPSITPLPGVAGLFYISGQKERSCPFPSESDTSSATSEGFYEIEYDCLNNTSPDIFVWKYSDKNFGKFQNVEILKCGNRTNVPKSYKMAFKTPGIYYFLKSGCSGLMSEVKLADDPQLDSEFYEKVKSIRIINDSENSYGFLVHSTNEYRGYCMLPKMINSTNNNEECFTLNIPVASINIFKWNKSEWASSGDGIVLYSKPFGYKTGAKAGFYKILPANIKERYENGRLDKAEFNYTKIAVPEEEMATHKYFQQSPGSAEVLGDYLVTFYSENPNDSGGRAPCQTFVSENVPNFNDTEIGKEGNIIKYLNVIPTK